MGGREKPLSGIVIGEPVTIDDSFYRRYQAAEGTPKGGLSLFTSVYYDAGQVYDKIRNLRIRNQVQSWGVGLLFRPQGSFPIGFFFSNPINPKPTDDTERFQFTIRGVF